MKKLLAVSRILVYYDHPQVFIAKDNVETNFLCLLIEEGEDGLKYISTSISSFRLKQFLRGLIDLRQILEEPEIMEWYVLQEKATSYFEAEIWKESKLPEDYLPSSGFKFKEQIHSDEAIQNEVIERNNAVIHLALSDHEDNYSIEADDLGDIVKLYQVILENCYKKTVSNAKLNPKQKRNYYIPDNYKLRAFTASRSSFNLHLYSTAEVDMFGYSNVVLGLEKLDELIGDVEANERYIASLRSVKGHAISSLKRLMKKLIENDIELKHKWAAPNNLTPHFNTINRFKAEKIYEILNQSDELAEETREFTGHFVQVDVEKGTWRILNIEDEKEYHGTATNSILSGVTVHTVAYKIVCKEIVEELKINESERTSYILQNIIEVDDSSIE